jgi:hypothetical protein
MAGPTWSLGWASVRHHEPQRLRCSSCRRWDCRERHRAAWASRSSHRPICGDHLRQHDQSTY